jgi:hypothetical protein
VLVTSNIIQGVVEGKVRIGTANELFLFKKSPKSECGLDSRIYGINPSFA